MIVCLAPRRRPVARSRLEPAWIIKRAVREALEGWEHDDEGKYWASFAPPAPITHCRCQQSSSSRGVRHITCRVDCSRPFLSGIAHRRSMTAADKTALPDWPDARS